MMLTRRTGRFGLFRHFFVIVALLIGATTVSHGQSVGELQTSALLAMQSGKYDEAIDLMYAYIDSIAGSNSPRVVEKAQDMRFKQATLLIMQERPDEAVEVLKKYTEDPLMAPKMRQALKMLTTCLYDSALYEECVTAVTNALYYNENPVLEAEIVRKGESADFSKKKVEPEPEYSEEEIVTLHMTLAESYYNLDRWLDCVEPFSYVIANTPTGSRKGYAIMQVINALVYAEDYERILQWIPQLFRTNARYDIRVNMGLMNVAAALYDVEEYDSALPLYRMIMPKDELVAYQERRMRNMRIEAGLTPNYGEELTADEFILFGSNSAYVVKEQVTKRLGQDEAEVEDDKPEVPIELLELEALVKALKDLPPYDLNIKYNMADLYSTVDRYWEAVKFFDVVYAADPTTDVGQRCMYDMVQLMLEELGETEEAEQKALAHIGKYKEGITTRQIAYLLTGHYQKIDQMEKTKTLKPYVDEFVRTDDATILQYDTEIYFMIAVSDLVAQNFAESEKAFKYVLDEFPDSRQEANCTYWYGMSKMFLGKYSEALPVFDEYIKKFPDGPYVDECNFQGGVCMFGTERYEDAMNRFTYVIENYPDSSVYPEANSMRGDLYSADVLNWSENDNAFDYLAAAIDDYERAYAASSKASQATYATFKIAEIREAEEKWDDILKVSQRYLDEWGTDGGDIAKALFWIGKTQLQLGKYDEALATYLDSIVKYGTDLRQDGVDLMIAELVKISIMYLDFEQRDKLNEDVKAELDLAEDETLKLRLRVALAKLEGTEIELGTTLIDELETLDNASPPVLAVICDASMALEKYERAEELLTIFVNKFEDSDYMRSAYKLRAYGQYAEQDYEATLGTIEDAQSLYGTDFDVAWAQLLKAKVLLEEGDIDQAREENMSVLVVPSWRGAPVAEATYQLGQVEEAAENYPKSHGFYQRVYVQYKGHNGGNWAADGYLAAARVLEKMDLIEEMKNTLRAMLVDKYVNKLPQADIAREKLGAAEAGELDAFFATGGETNFSVSVEAEMKSESADASEESFSGFGLDEEAEEDSDATESSDMPAEEVATAETNETEVVEDNVSDEVAEMGTEGESSSTNLVEESSTGENE